MTSTAIPNRILYSYDEAAQLLGLSSGQALRDLVCRRRGPVLTREGRRVLFNIRDLHAWADARREVLPQPAESAASELAAPSPEKPRRRRGRPSVAERQASLRE